MQVLVAHSCLTLCDPMDGSLPDSSVCEILQARILEWVAIPFSRESSHPEMEHGSSYVAGRVFTIGVTMEALSVWLNTYFTTVIITWT